MHQPASLSALRKFDLEEFNRNVTDEELLSDLRTVYAALSPNQKRLTFRAYNRNGKFSSSTIAARFSSWNAALERARVALVAEKSISVDALFNNLREVWIAKGRQPTLRDMDQKPSRYAANTYAERFHGWRNALIQFVSTIDDMQPAPNLDGKQSEYRPHKTQERRLVTPH